MTLPAFSTERRGHTIQNARIKMMALATANATADFTTVLCQHRINRHERPNQFRNCLHILDFEIASTAAEFGLFEICHPHEISMFPNPGVRIIRPDPGWIGPAMNG